MKTLCAVLTAVLLCSVLAAVSDAAAPPKAIDRDEAVKIALAFLKKQEYASRYHRDNPLVTLRKGEYFVEFRDKRKYVKPGVCIIAVHSVTGKVRHVPVE